MSFPNHPNQHRRQARCTARVLSIIISYIYPSDIFDRVRSPCVPGRVRVDSTGILDLAHGGTTATDTATEVGTAATSIHDVDGEGGYEGSPAEPQEEGGGLGEAAVLLGLVIAGEHGSGMGVVLRNVRSYS
jgi:hypothetical protein